MSAISNNSNDTLEYNLTVPEQKQIRAIATKLESVIELRRQAEKMESGLKSDLKELLKPAYFSHNVDVQTGEEAVHTFDVGGLQVNFVNAYVIKDSQHSQKLAKVLGANHPLLDYIQDNHFLTINLNDLGEDEMLEVSEQITSVTAKYGIRPEVQNVVMIAPEFHGDRNVYLSEGDNLTLDETLPLQIQVSLIE